MTDLYLHQTHQTIADFRAIENYLVEQLQGSGAKGLHIFPELYLSGYPLQDLCLQKAFVTKYLDLLDRLSQFAQSLSDEYQEDELCVLLGGPQYNLTEDGSIASIQNSIFKLVPGKPLTSIYSKKLLPNYDIFDEKKYFIEGSEDGILEWKNLKIGLLICEDMWFTNLHNQDPVEELFKNCQSQQTKLDLIVNLSASPFFVGKQSKRIQRAKSISDQFNAPFAYVNRVGGEDEILFDGQSFVIGKELLVAKTFRSDLVKTQIMPLDSNRDQAIENSTTRDKDLTWQQLFEAELDISSPPKLRSYNQDELQSLLHALGFGLQEYATKCGFKKFLIALSGGMDSALVLTIAKLFQRDGQSIEAIYMPGLYSAGLSFELANQLCQNLGIPLATMPIKFLHANVNNLFTQTFGKKLEGLADENIQSRLRGALIYAHSNQTGSMVINTSNKSELAVGYSTLYGDSVGAISMLGDVYKSQVYDLAEFINQHYQNIIPEGLITRPPSAELRENQEDQQSLPPYSVLDAILECVLSFSHDRKDLLEAGFAAQDVEKVLSLYKNSEYKRSQFCPIVKVRAKSFGFGYRIPVTKSSEIYR